MPLAPAHMLPGDDPRYAYLSTFHWMPSINGYSGYYPPSYLDRVHRLQVFPADPSTQLLRRAGCPVRDRPHICLPGGRSGVSAHGADA